MQALGATVSLHSETKIVAVSSGTGRTGKSIVALNLAEFFSKQTTNGKANKVLLLDGNLKQRGIALRINGHTFDNFFNLIDQIDRQKSLTKRITRVFTDYLEFSGDYPYREDMILKNHTLGMDIISSGFDFNAEYDYESQDLADILTVVSRFYDVVIIDCGSDIESVLTRTWLAFASRIILTINPEIDSLSQTASAAKFLCRAVPDPLNSGQTIKLATPDKIGFVMNKMTDNAKPKGLSETARDLARMMFPWSNDVFFMPDVKTMTEDINRGHVVVQDKAYQKSIAQIAAWL